jgi:hypothetical protein
MVLENLVYTKSNLMLITLEKLFMLLGEVIDDFSENYAQHTLFGQSEKFLRVFFSVLI